MKRAALFVCATLALGCVKFTGPKDTSISGLAWFMNPEIVCEEIAPDGSTIKTTVKMNRTVQEDIVQPVIGTGLPLLEQMGLMYLQQQAALAAPATDPVDPP